MYEQALPSYSTERYFLLSEIEQKTHIHYSQEDESEAHLPEQQPLLTILYCLWDVTSQIECDVVMTKIHDMLSYITKKKLLSKNLLISIDILIKNKQNLDKSVREWIEEVMMQLHSLSEKDTVTAVIGVSDNTAAMPGLEKCYEFIEQINPGVEEQARNIAFIAPLGKEMMGHDPTLDPDARSGVFQSLFWMHKDSENEFVKKIKLVKENSPRIPSKSKRRSLLFNIAYLMPLVAIVCYLVYMLYKKI